MIIAEPEPAEPDVILGQAWTISVVGSSTTKCCDKNKNNCESIDRKDCGIKCCQKFYNDSVNSDIVYTATGEGSFMHMLGQKTLHAQHSCLGY